MKSVDGVLVWCIARRDHLKKLIPLMESGKITMHEVRDGIQVDITQETLAENRGLLHEVEELIAKHE